MSMGSQPFPEPLLVRIHSQCFTSEVMGSLRCDCRDQLDFALERIAQEGSGILIYLQQEGRGIGLAAKIKAYALQDQGYDTLEANHRLGFAGDLRDFTAASELLRSKGVSRIRLHTNNPNKIEALRQAGIEITEVIHSIARVNEFNQRYLQTKVQRMGHDKALTKAFIQSLREHSDPLEQ